MGPSVLSGLSILCGLTSGGVIQGAYVYGLTCGPTVDHYMTHHLYYSFVFDLLRYLFVYIYIYIYIYIHICVTTYLFMHFGIKDVSFVCCILCW